MVGDRAQDVVGARAHGIGCVGVRWGYAVPGELETAGATHLVDTPRRAARDAAPQLPGRGSRRSRLRVRGQPRVPSGGSPGTTPSTVSA